MPNTIAPPTSEEVDLYAREIFAISISLPLEGRTSESCVRIEDAFCSRMHTMAPQLEIEFTWSACNSPGQAIIDECHPLRVHDGAVQPFPKITRFGFEMANALGVRIQDELLASIEQEA